MRAWGLSRDALPPGSDVKGFFLMDLFFFGGGFEILFSLAFFAVLAVILVTAVRGLLQWNQTTIPAPDRACRRGGEAPPPRTPPTIQAARRVTSSTTYYATFQVESGDR
ncbi:MAG: hypothetical protein ACLR7U_09175 [Ruthenibacterium lactatiformans]